MKKLLFWSVLEHGKQTAHQSFAKVTETPLKKWVMDTFV